MPILYSISSSNLQIPVRQHVSRITNTGALLRIEKKNKVRRVQPWTVKSGTTPVTTARKIDRTSSTGRSLSYFFLVQYSPSAHVSLVSSTRYLGTLPLLTLPRRSRVFPAARDEAVLNRNSLFLSTSDLLLDYRAARSEYTASICEKKSPRKRRNRTQGAKAAEQNKGHNALQIEKLSYGSIPLLKPARTWE